MKPPSDSVHAWRLRVYRWTTQEGPEMDRPLECIIDLPLNEGHKLPTSGLEDTHGSIERAHLPPAKTLREIIER